MPISQAVLEQHSQPNVVLAESYEFLSDVINRFLDSGLPEKETFLVTKLDDDTYRAERFDRISTALDRHGEQELYKPLADLNWLPKVWKVTGIEGRMDDDDLIAWARRTDGRALVVEEAHTFAGLVYEPVRMRGGLSASLFETVQNFMARTRSLFQDEESFAPAKGLEAQPRGFERAEEFTEAIEAAPEFLQDMPEEIVLEEIVLEESREESFALPPMGDDESPPPEPALTVPFHTDIRFANWLKPDQTKPLTVQLTKEAATVSVANTTVSVGFVEEFTPETIQVHLDAPGFSERSDTWQQTIEVFSFQDSDKATFILTAGQEESERQISIDFRHKERLIGHARFVVQVSAQEPVAAGPAAADALTFRQPPPPIEISPDPPPPPDVELRIRADGKRLTFELFSPHQEVDASHAPMGGTELTTEPQAYMQDYFDELSQLARNLGAGADAVSEISHRLTAIGNGLFLNLFPSKLQRKYWKLVKLRKEGIIASLHIVSDEPWIPWEMVKPVDMDEGESDDFLARGWQISRWLAGPGQPDGLRIADARLVAPDTDLTEVKREKDFFDTLPARQVAIAEPLRQLAQVRQVAREGVELLHFSTHGRVNSQNINSSSIVLQDNAELRPDDLVGEAVFGLRKRRPLVFLNTCHGARMGFSLSGLGGWASQMIVQARAGVFIGALWEVNDRLAADFALAFYGELQAGATLGEAFHSARNGIRESAPANSTWLAYTLYGDPNMRVTWGSDA